MDSAVKISLKLEKIYGLGFYLADGSVEEIRQKFDPQKIDPLFDDYISFKEMASGYQKNNQKIFPRLPKYFQDTLRIRHLKIDINTLSRYIDTNNLIEMRHLELKKNELKELQASKPTK